MGWAILALRKGVMRCDVDGLEVTEGTHADSGGGLAQCLEREDTKYTDPYWGGKFMAYVDVKHEKGGRDGKECAWVVGGDAVGDGCHCVFADAIAYIAAGVVL